MAIEPIAVVGDDPRLESLVTNQYVIVDGKACRYDGANLVDLRWRTRLGDFKPKNDEQRCLFDLLDNDDVPVKIVKGVAGSGKTICSIRFALAKMQSGKYDRLVVIRNPVVVGEEIGYLKGTYDDKVAPWTQPIIDNLDGGRYQFEQLMREGRLEFDVIGYVQGRSIDHSFILVTEAQNLSRLQMKMAGTRVGEGSVIVFDGDEEQIASSTYEKDNGMRQVVDKLAGHRRFGYMRLATSVRSEVAALFGTL